MADHKSAVKRIRQNEKRRARNQERRSTLRSALRNVEIALTKGNKKEAEAALKDATPLLDRAGQTWLVHPKNASRKVSRLSKRVSALK